MELKKIAYSQAKNEVLKATRNVSFEEVIREIEENRLVDNINHPNKDKFPYQKCLIVRLKEYIHVVPYVFDNDGAIFLKTIYPNRDLQEKYKLN